MKQKIEVQVTAAADEQWPRLIGKSDPFPIEMRFFMPIRRDTITLCGENCVLDEMDLPYFLTEYVGMQICFKNFASAAAWWTNPQPVKTGTLYCTFRSLDMGAIFLHESNVFIVSEPYANNQARGFGWAVCPKIGAATLFYPDNEVIPFYGQITINVGRDAE